MSDTSKPTIEPEFSWVEAMSVLDLQEGDRIVLKCARRITVEQAEMLTQHVNRILPGHEVLILPPDLELGVVRVKGNA